MLTCETPCFPPFTITLVLLFSFSYVVINLFLSIETNHDCESDSGLSKERLCLSYDKLSRYLVAIDEVTCVIPAELTRYSFIDGQQPGYMF